MTPEAPPPDAMADAPVPRGRMATEGSGQASWCRISSRAASTHPTVPSPPHTSTRKQGTWENTWNLGTGGQAVCHQPQPCDKWGRRSRPSDRMGTAHPTLEVSDTKHQPSPTSLSTGV